jgi:hypothetical protein
MLLLLTAPGQAAEGEEWEDEDDDEEERNDDEPSMEIRFVPSDILACSFVMMDMVVFEGRLNMKSYVCGRAGVKGSVTI